MATQPKKNKPKSARATKPRGKITVPKPLPPKPSPTPPASSPAPPDDLMDPLESPAGLILADIPPSLPMSDPQAAIWEPFDNDETRAFHELNFLKKEPPLANQVARAKAFYPIMKAYLKEDDVPDEVRLFLWSSSRLMKAIYDGLVEYEMETPTFLRSAYRLGRPSLDFRQAYDDSGDLIPHNFDLPKIVKAPGRAKKVVDSDVEADVQESVSVVESSAPPQKRRRVEVEIAKAPAAAVPVVQPAPAAPAKPDPRTINISSRDELTAALFSIPAEVTPTPAVMRIPRNYVTDALNPPLFNSEALPCTYCANLFLPCPGVDPNSARGSSCSRCSQRKEKCSFNWTPEELMKFFKHIRPFHNVAPHSIASFLQRLYQATVDADYTALLHARSLSAQRLAAQDVAVVLKNADEAMSKAAFDSIFEDSEDGDRIREIVSNYFKNVAEFNANDDFDADHPTSPVFPPPDDAPADTRGTYHPALSKRTVPAPSFGQVDASLATGTLSVPLARRDYQLSSAVDFSRSGSAHAPLARDADKVHAFSKKPPYGPAGIAKPRSKDRRPSFVEGSSTGQELRRSSRRQQSDSP
ncbi:hypothetical protein R3P38DRAFT_2789062 [Favolaschia claudopus]|uniref:Uncharacterized protein n=1 Tax=Favolaschia claudopus TaxID=2862362 RepID=A0AAW0AK38_9AGAR